MTRDEVLRIGRQAGAFIEAAQEKDLLWLERFAALVAAAEREECAKVCETVGNHNITAACAEAIRARKP